MDRAAECRYVTGKPRHLLAIIAFQSAVVSFTQDTDEGRHVLSLLRRAFDQRLTFTVGRY